MIHNLLEATRSDRMIKDSLPDNQREIINRLNMKHEQSHRMIFIDGSYGYIVKI